MHKLIRHTLAFSTIYGTEVSDNLYRTKLLKSIIQEATLLLSEQKSVNSKALLLKPGESPATRKILSNDIDSQIDNCDDSFYTVNFTSPFYERLN